MKIFTPVTMMAIHGQAPFLEETPPTILLRLLRFGTPAPQTQLMGAGEAVVEEGPDSRVDAVEVSFFLSSVTDCVVELTGVSAVVIVMAVDESS